MIFNLGRFEGNKYIKRVNFSKAVLWKDKQISLRADVCNQIRERGVEFIVFEDERKNQRWTASVSELREVAVRKTEGQEEQFYFPIGIFKVGKMRKGSVPEPASVLPKINQLKLL